MEEVACDWGFEARNFGRRWGKHPRLSITHSQMCYDCIGGKFRGKSFHVNECGMMLHLLVHSSFVYFPSSINKIIYMYISPATKWRNNQNDPLTSPYDVH